jgi:hypothetical protein
MIFSFEYERKPLTLECFSFTVLLILASQRIEVVIAEWFQVQKKNYKTFFFYSSVWLRTIKLERLSQKTPFN